MVDGSEVPDDSPRIVADFLVEFPVSLSNLRRSLEHGHFCTIIVLASESAILQILVVLGVILTILLNDGLVSESGSIDSLTAEVSVLGLEDNAGDALLDEHVQDVDITGEVGKFVSSLGNLLKFNNFFLGECAKNILDASEGSLQTFDAGLHASEFSFDAIEDFLEFSTGEVVSELSLKSLKVRELSIVDQLVLQSLKFGLERSQTSVDSGEVGLSVRNLLLDLLLEFSSEVIDQLINLSVGVHTFNHSLESFELGLAELCGEFSLKSGNTSFESLEGVDLSLKVQLDGVDIINSSIALEELGILFVDSVHTVNQFLQSGLVGFTIEDSPDFGEGGVDLISLSTCCDFGFECLHSLLKSSNFGSLSSEFHLCGESRMSSSTLGPEGCQVSFQFLLKLYERRLISLLVDVVVIVFTRNEHARGSQCKGHQEQRAKNFLFH